ncbi:MAG: CRISPR-associated endonuclease Cas3'' [Azospirillaceae bacterium]
MSDIPFAHSLDGQPEHRWEPLDAHLQAVASRAAAFGAAFGWGRVAEVAGLLHDLGKLSPDFQAYIRGERPKGGDHSSAGAVLGQRTYPAGIGRLVASVVAAHHAGLADGVDLDRRLEAAADLVPDDWRSLIAELPPPQALAPTTRFKAGPPGFCEAFLARMVFSALVDADFLETERFYAQARSETVDRAIPAGIDDLAERLRRHMDGVARAASPSPVNRLRAEVLESAVSRAGETPGLFTLTVPTGGGKTLASLSFALEHARRHGARRVIQVIPYTSIIEQTAAVFRDALGDEDTVLEHHAAFDWEGAEAARTDEEGRAGLRKLRRAAENWDAPIVVTTAVQFFESLFADRPSRCRKLHTIAGSVIVLDEAQTLPLPLMRPALAAIDELCRNYRASVVLCTATQPAIRMQDGFRGGLDIPPERELAPDPPRLYGALRRVETEVLPDPIDDDALTARLADRERVLCIVNSRAHARALFDRIADLPGAAHLSTLMCAAHRRQVLAGVRRALAAGEPVRLVATSLVEAGVDVDFPEVWRAAAGIDSIAQAAGRCNREGRLDGRLGRLVVFEPASARPPHEIAVRWQAARDALRRHGDPLSLDAVRHYFEELVWQKGPESLDAVEVDGKRGILAALSERADSGRFPFASIAAAFRLIDEAGEPVLVPWRADESDTAVADLLDDIAAADRPRAGQMRRMQQYLVQLPHWLHARWLAEGRLVPVREDWCDGVLMLAASDLYDPRSGVNPGADDTRPAEANIIA